MRAGERSGGEKLDREIAVGDGVERIGRGPVEAERGGGRVAVDRERGAGERGGAERALVEPDAAIGETAAVAPDHLDIGQEVMSERDRLRDLKMREAGHHRVGMRLGLIDQRALKLAQRRVEAVDRAAHPEAEIGRDLVVARARRVQPSGGRADQFGEPRLDIQVDVLVGLAEDEGAALDLRPDLL